jgi:DNA-binding PadR family transcriptional regulator
MASEDLQDQDLSLPVEPLFKGILSIAIMNLISRKPMHGGEISQVLKEKFEIGTPRAIIYVVLRKLEGDGLLVSNWDILESGPARRIYHITEEGLQYLKYARDRLKRSNEIIEILLAEKF